MRPRLARPAFAAAAAAATAAAASLLCLAPRAASAGGATAPAEAPAPVARAEVVADPMSQLRQRLEEKLGAVKAPDAVGTHELRVSSRQPAEDLAKAHRARVAASKASAAPPKPHKPHWAYGGAGAPEHWGELEPGFELCGKGERQSPIDIRDGIAVQLQPIQFDYRPGSFQVIDNGHTVQVDVARGSSIEVLGRRYDLVQFHFHRPSEERIAGRQFDMSVHLVHKDPAGHLAVVAVLVERGSDQPVLQQVWNNLPLEKRSPVPGHGEIDPAGLLPPERGYYTYMGSLTTPPCSEGVLWMVMQQPVPASTGQIDIFSRLYPMNARPVQRSAGRLIKQSN